MASLWLYIIPVFQFLALCVASYGLYIVCRWAFYRMPHRFKMRFWLYRNEKVRELVPLLKEAIRLDRAHRFSTGSFERSMDYFDEYQSQVKLIRLEMSNLGFDLPFRHIEAWEMFIRDLRMYVERGTYEDVQRLCDDVREQL